jgi:AcrR family transcriptional regulator
LSPADATRRGKVHSRGGALKSRAISPNRAFSGASLGYEMRRKRNDPRRELTQAALIEAAEELFADHGVDNVSLRQIGEAIGSDNNAVVTYYFGSKKGLLRAIYEYRVPALEAKRSELLAAADAAGRGEDMLILLHAQWAPIFEQRNANGKPSYAGFLGSISHSPLISVTTLARSYPRTREITDRLRRLANLSERLFWQRLRLISTMMILAIQDAVELEQDQAKPSQINAVFADALQMGTAALCAPIGAASGLRRLRVPASSVRRQTLAVAPQSRG